MDIEFNLHNYDRSIVGLANSILKSFGCNATGTTIPVVDDVLAKNYKNVVVLLLDGLGTSILNEHAGKDGFLRKHYIWTRGDGPFVLTKTGENDMI